MQIQIVSTFQVITKSKTFLLESPWIQNSITSWLQAPPNQPGKFVSNFSGLNILKKKHVTSTTTTSLDPRGHQKCFSPTKVDNCTLWWTAKDKVQAFHWDHHRRLWLVPVEALLVCCVWVWGWKELLVKLKVMEIFWLIHQIPVLQYEWMHRCW